MSALVQTQVTSADIAALVSTLPLGARLDFVCATFAGMGPDGVAYVQKCLAKSGTPAEKASVLVQGAHYYSRRCDCEKDKDPTLGAGPGPARTYAIDAPLPWGANTPVTIPVDALATDFANALQPRVDQALQAATASIRQAVEEGVSKPIQQGLASGQLVVNQAASKVSYTVVFVSFLAGVAAALAATKVVERRKRETRNG